MTTPSSRQSPHTPLPSRPTGLIGPIFSARTWSDTWFLASTLFVGLWWFVLVTVLLVFGLATLVVAVGVPVLIVGFAAARAAADSERRRLETIRVHLPAAPPGPEARPTGGGGWTRLRSELSDARNHRSLAYVGLLLVLGPIWFSLTVTAWTVPLSLIATPLMVAAGFEPSASSAAGGWEITIDTMSQAGAVAAVGVLLLPLAPRIIAAMARSHARIAERFLMPSGPDPRNADPIPDDANRDRIGVPTTTQGVAR